MDKLRIRRKQATDEFQARKKQAGEIAEEVSVRARATAADAQRRLGALNIRPLAIAGIAGAGIAAYVVYQFTRSRDPKFPDTPLPNGCIINDQLVIATASQLFEQFDNYQIQLIPMNSFRPRCVALENYFQLNDCDFIAVANYYKNNFDITIRQSISNIGAGSCVAFFSTDWEAEVLNRMTALGIP